MIRIAAYSSTVMGVGTLTTVRLTSMVTAALSTLSMPIVNNVAAGTTRTSPHFRCAASVVAVKNTAGTLRATIAIKLAALASITMRSRLTVACLTLESSVLGTCAAAVSHTRRSTGGLTNRTSQVSSTAKIQMET